MKHSATHDAVFVDPLIAQTRSGCSPSTTARLALLLVATTACAFPRPPDIVVDASQVADGALEPVPDGPPAPVVAIHVSPARDDSNDGLVLPVKTLKRAIGLAAASAEITQIVLAVLAAGTYSSSSGESFPYIILSQWGARGTVPAGHKP